MNKDEPKPAALLPLPPATLLGEALDEWNRRGPELERLGLLTALDVPSFTAYCRAWGRYVDAEAKVEKTGEVVMTRTGHPMVNPYRSVANKALKFCQQFWGEFGMTPSARSRVSVQKKISTPLDRQHERFFGASRG